MNHEAIYKLHSNVKFIDEDDNGNLICYDDNGNIVTFTDDEQTAIDAKETELINAFNLAQLRHERTLKLAETDYWDNSDTPAMSQAQIDYRQALRDITKTYSSLDTVVWPTRP